MQNKDLAMMKNPSNWPRFPILPLKIQAKDKFPFKLCSCPRVGYLINFRRTEVFLGCIFDIPNNTSLKEFCKSQNSIQYNSFEEIIQAGWLVD